MPRRHRRGPGHALTGTALVPAAPPRRRDGLLTGVLLALAVGIGATLALPHARTIAAEAAEPPALLHWRGAAERHRLALELAQARADALERQIDTLNQRLRETREELTFFRQARDTKR